MNTNELKHHGILGMKWGVRRYQNKDGSLTAAGKKRYSSEEKKEDDTPRKGLTDNQKKYIKIGAAAVATGLAVYGTYKFSKWVDDQNLKLAAHTGMEFANRFQEEIRPKIPYGSGSMGQHRYVIGQGVANAAAGELASLVSEKVYPQKVDSRIKNAFNASAVSRGKKAVFDIFDYNQTVGEILADQKVFDDGSSEFAKLVRDTYGTGGSLSSEIEQLYRSLYIANLKK